jgi:ATP synthase protein I
MDIEKNTTISRAFSKAVRWQITITLIITCVSLLVADVSAAVSAFVGGTSVLLGSFAGMLVAQNNSRSSGGVLVSLLIAEAVKVLLIALLLLIAFKYYQSLVPLALIGGLAGSALASGAGLRTMNNENDK